MLFVKIVKTQKLAENEGLIFMRNFLLHIQYIYDIPIYICSYEYKEMHLIELNYLYRRQKQLIGKCNYKIIPKKI